MPFISKKARNCFCSRLGHLYGGDDIFYAYEINAQSYEEHKKLHNVMNSRLSAFFEGIDDKSRDNIIGLMHIIDEELTRMEENNDF